MERLLDPDGHGPRFRAAAAVRSGTPLRQLANTVNHMPGGRVAGRTVRPGYPGGGVGRLLQAHETSLGRMADAQNRWLLVLTLRRPGPDGEKHAEPRMETGPGRTSVNTVNRGDEPG